MAEVLTLSRGFDHLGEIAKTVGDLRGLRTVIHELIQNADDAKATRMCFTVGKDTLEAWNDADFTRCSDIASRECEWLAATGHRCDFHSFRNIGSGDKRNRPGTTGAFGIGFMAVYQLTDLPELLSSGEHWIIDETADEKNRITRRPAPDSHEGTTFRLPWARQLSGFRKKIRQEAVASATIARFFDELEEALPRAMPFLKHLQQIEITDRAQKRSFDREVGSQRVVVESSAGARWTWLVLRDDFAGPADGLKLLYPDQIEAARSAEVALAFPLDECAEAGTLYATLPTEEGSHLPLLINADFYPASDRKRIRFDDAPESEFNRAAIAAASKLIAAELERLPDLLGDARFIDLLIKAQDLSRQVANDHIDASFGAFRSDLAEVLPDVPVVPAATGGRHCTNAVRLWREAVELNAAAVLSDIDVLLVHPDHREGWYQLRSQESGLQELSLGDITAGLQEAGITQRRLVDQMPGRLGTASGLAMLRTVIETLLASSGRASQETRRVLLRCAIAPGCDGACWPLDELYVADPETQSVLASAGLWLAYLDTEELGGDNVHLSSLIPAIDAALALDMLEGAAESQTLSQNLDSGRILGWFARREADLDGSKRARLANLPIFPTATGPMALNGLALPGDFTDPLGIARIVAVGTIEDLRPFLRRLGARPLTFALYCTGFVPGAITGGHVDDGGRRRLSGLLAARWSQICDDDQVRRALSPLPVVPCSDGVWRPAGQVYIASDELKAIFGSRVNFTAFLPGQRAAYGDLYRWLGAAPEPRAPDLIRRCYDLISGPPRHRETAEAIIKYLGRRYRNDSAAVEEDYAKLRDIGWLPAEGRQARGMRPEAVFAVFRRWLFESQGTFLDLPKPVQEEAAGFLEWLGVNSVPGPKLVVDHLLWSSERGKEVYEDVWLYLDQHADDNALDALLSRPCLLLDNGKYVRPADVYWGDHPFGRWRYRLGPKFRSRQALLDRLRVAEVPAPKDAIEVLQDIAAKHGGEAAPLLAEDVPVVHNCWRLLSDGLISGEVESVDLELLAVDEVVLDARNWLRTPRDVFFRDSVSLASRFDDSLLPRLIERPEGVWSALAAAGVQNLSDAVTTRVVEAEGDSPHGQPGERLRNRRMLLLRVLGHDPRAAANLDNFYATVQIRHLARLEIQQSLEVGSDLYVSAPHRRAALYRPEDNDLLCVEPPAAALAWVEVAREVVRALRVDSGQPSALASALKVVLEASTAGAAALELDELGFPALDPLVVVPVEGSVADSLGGTSAGDSGEADDQGEVPAGAEDPYTTSGAASGSADDRSGAGKAAAPDETPKGDHGGSGATDTPPAVGPGSGKRSKTAGQDRSGEAAQTRLRSYVAPTRPGTSGDTADRSASDPVERAGVNAVLAYEREHGRDPVEMPPTNPGFDIRSADAEGRVRIIEVKATAGRWDARGVGLSNFQFTTAQQRREEFWLYVVENAVTNPRVHPINDPASKVDQYFFDDGWRAVGEAEAAARPALESLDLITTPRRGTVPYFAPGNPRVGDPGAADGWLACADARCDEGWFAVQVTGYGLGLAFYGGIAYVEPMEGLPEDGERVLVLLHDQVDPDSGTQYSLRRWDPERDLADRELALRLTSDGSVEPLTVRAPDQAKVLGRLQTLVRAAEVGSIQAG